VIETGLYVGDVMHRRLRPRLHKFKYRGFWLTLDLDTLPQVAAPLRLFSLDRFNLFSFNVADHADGKPGFLREKISKLVRDAGFRADGKILLMTMPRVCGFVFNPLSVYFCHDSSDRLTAIVWEVSNTFGARHSYVIGVGDADARVLRQRAPKTLHVSPFIDMSIDYTFRVVRRPGALDIGIVDHDAQGPLLTAALTAKRQELTDRALLATFARLPFATMQVVAAIHWEALRLWLKGAKFRSTPEGAAPPISALSSSAHAPDSSDDKQRAPHSNAA
jgi:uncharacterized protein